MSLASPTATLPDRPQAAHGSARLPPAPPPPLDLRQGTNHPLSLRYAEIHDAVLVDAEVAHGRAQPSLDTRGGTPFVRVARCAVRHGLQQPDVLELMVGELSRYYTAVRPDSAAQWLGLGDDAHPRLRAAPPWAAVFPWRARTLESYRKAYEDAAWAENRAVGRDVGISDGWLFCGPASPTKIRVEAERILFVLRRIARDGYQRSDGADGDVRATALVDDALKWRWLITAGNHRASAAAALGYERIPVRVNLVISRGDCRYWKHVVEGLFTEAQALTVFDAFFHATPGPVVRAWHAQDPSTGRTPT